MYIYIVYSIVYDWLFLSDKFFNKKVVNWMIVWFCLFSNKPCAADYQELFPNEHFGDFGDFGVFKGWSVTHQHSVPGLCQL